MGEVFVNKSNTPTNNGLQLSKQHSCKEGCTPRLRSDHLSQPSTRSQTINETEEIVEK